MRFLPKALRASCPQGALRPVSVTRRRFLVRLRPASSHRTFTSGALFQPRLTWVSNARNMVKANAIGRKNKPNDGSMRRSRAVRRPGKVAPVPGRRDAAARQFLRDPGIEGGGRASSPVAGRVYSKGVVALSRFICNRPNHRKRNRACRGRASLEGRLQTFSYRTFPLILGHPHISDTPDVTAHTSMTR